MKRTTPSSSRIQHTFPRDESEAVNSVFSVSVVMRMISYHFVIRRGLRVGADAMRSTGLTGEGGYVDQLRSEPHCLFSIGYQT